MSLQDPGSRRLEHQSPPLESPRPRAGLVPNPFESERPSRTEPPLLKRLGENEKSSALEN